MKSVKKEMGSHIIIGRGEKIFLAINNVIMFFLIIITIYPMLYVLFCSLSDPYELQKVNGLMWRPAGFSLIGYQAVLETKNLWLGLRNTIFYVIISTVLHLSITVLAAYPMSRPNVMLKRPIMLYMVFTMYFSGGMIPAFLLMRNLKLINTVWAMIVPGVFGVYNMIIIRENMRAIPESLYESAVLDGAGHLQILTKIVLPLSKATLATITLFFAVGKWSEWYGALVYLQKRRDLYPLQMFLRELLITGEAMDSTFDSMAMENTAADFYLQKEVIKHAIIIASTVPILMVYPFLQKHFVKGVFVGAVKE